MINYREYQEKDWKTICHIHDRARPDELIGSCDPRGFIPIEEDKEVDDLKRRTIRRGRQRQSMHVFENETGKITLIIIHVRHGVAVPQLGA